MDNEPALLRADVRITGRVQGVCFRARTCEKARSCGVSGYVRNLSDGSVEAVFEGEPGSVRRVVTWCHEGPKSARVQNVRVDWSHPEKPAHREFRVRG